jgi:hypothetical protein
MDMTKHRQAREAQRVTWGGHLDQWQASGKSIKTFCAETGLKIHQFFYWRKVLSPKPEPAGFVELKVKPVGGLIVEVKGCRIRVEPGFEADQLRQVVAALRDL